MPKSDSVVYSNKLNQIALGVLKEQEQNLFFSILVKLKDKGHEPITFTATELVNMCGKRYTLAQIDRQTQSLREHFFKLDFTQITNFPDGSSENDTINLFKRMTIRFNDQKIMESLTIEVNEDFEFILNALKANFTNFELANFLALHGKYAKTLFRLLKQFKATGKATFEKEKFKELMGVPKSKKYNDFNELETRILKPAIKELTWDDGQPDLFTDYRGADRPAFKNLSYRKIKKDPTKKTSPIVAIEFTWEPEAAAAQEKNPPIAAGYKVDESGKLVPDMSNFEKPRKA